jgi:hypothetical protein
VTLAGPDARESPEAGRDVRESSELSRKLPPPRLAFERETMTADFADLVAPRRRWLDALRIALPRDRYFAGLYLIGCVNGLVGRMIYTFNLEGWTGVVMGFDINVIVFFACFAGIAALLEERQDQIRPADLVVGLVFLVLVSLPSFPVSWVAVTGLSLYLLLFAGEQQHPDRRRGAIILLALCVPLLWSKLVFQFFAPLLLELDARFVEVLLGTERVGNMLRFADDSGYMVITPACTSFGNISLAFLCWVTITQWAKHRWAPMDLLWSSLACASVVTVNVTRIALTGLSRGNYEAIHNETGEMVGGLVMLALMVGFSVFGARRELFARA